MSLYIRIYIRRNVETRPQGLYSPWNSPGHNIGVGSLSLLQGIFPTQGSNPDLLYCRQIHYQLSHQGSPYKKTCKNKRHTGRRPCDDRGKDRNDAAITNKHQRSMSITRSWKEFYLVSGKTWPCWHLDFDFLPPELWKNKFVINHLVCGTLLQQPKETNLPYWISSLFLQQPEYNSSH